MANPSWQFQQHHLLPLLASVVLLALSAVSQARVCPSCGSTPVPYPLSTASDCGDPAYPIRCDAASRTLFFDTSNVTSYPVLSVSPESQRLVIRPSPFVPGACIAQDLPANGLQLNRSRPFNITQSNTIFWLNCTTRLLQSPLNCSATSPCHAYVNSTTAAASCLPAPICCTFGAGGSTTSYSLRANVSGCSAYRSFVNLDTSTPIAQWGQREGVEIQWASPREPLCTSQANCEAGANATCRADPIGVGGVRRCFCNAGLRWDPFNGTCVNNVPSCEATGSCGGSNHAPLIAGLISGVSGALLVGVIGYLFYKRQRRIRAARERIAKERQDILNANNSSGRSAKNFTDREIKKATGNFSRNNLLGSGGYGDVFKGSLDDGTMVAVKCAKIGNAKSTEQVLNEVRILSQVNHRNLVRLLGCCVELEQPLMVYEFIPNGTLFDHLHGLRSTPDQPLTWRHRLTVAHQTAEALAYLHFSAVPPIYHRDVKSSNILLDEKLNAKVSDFGLSRLAVSDLSHISTCAQGTLGYLDPEYYRNYQLTDKSDVYSFGVVLLELLTSQKAIDFNRDADDVNLAVYVQRRVEEERLIDTIDKSLTMGASQLELDTIKALGFLAVSCLEERRQNRPSMKEVVEEIEYIMSIEAGRAAEERPPKSEV